MSTYRIKAFCLVVALAGAGAVGVLTHVQRTGAAAAAAARPALAFLTPPPLVPCRRGTFKSSQDKIPSGWHGTVFQLSQAYPDTPPAPENYPWKSIDYKSNPQAYMMALRDYVFEGNLDPHNPNADWVIQNNPVRKWYHAPWMDAGQNGREFIHGMTRELASVPGQLWTNPPQTASIQNWAVGFYNPPGGYVIGQVWCDPTNPSLSSVSFPDGTVSAKLLFSGAPVSQVPFLANSVQWTANINTTPTDPTSPRQPQTVRLLQMDVAVRDSRNTDTGWNFGTFIYNPDGGGSTPWQNMQPVGLMWGDDPGVTPNNGLPIKQSWLNPGVATLMQHYGWAERLNGPVDNPLSSCLSCHAVAGWPVAPLTPPRNATDAQRLNWFRNIPAGQPFQAGQSSHDYSLQLTFGIRQFKSANPAAGHPHALAAQTAGGAPLPVVNRAGEPEAQYREDVTRELARRKARMRARGRK